MDVELGNAPLCGTHTSANGAGKNGNNGIALSNLPNKNSMFDTPAIPKYANAYHVYFLAIAMTFGGLHTDWSFGLRNGFYIYLIGLLVISVGHIALVCCSAEMTGILPFSGGAYGFARVTLGPYIGYIVGCCDAYRSLTYVMRRVFTFGRMMTIATSAPTSYQPLFWLLFFIPSIAVDSLGSTKFWQLICVFGVVALLTTLFYLLATSTEMNFSHYVIHQEDQNVMNSGLEGFLFAVVSASRAYLGLASLPLCCEETKEPRTAVPWAMITSLGTIVCLQVCVTFAACALAPGINGLSTTEYPLLPGFAALFQASSAQVMWLSIPAVYVTCFGYAYSYGRLMCALSRSGLLPSVGALVYGERQSPVAAMVAGNLLVFVVMLVLFFNDWEETIVFASGSLAALVVYASVFSSFLIFRNRFTTLQKTFVNPFGTVSAVVGILVFCIPTIYVFGFLRNRVATICIFVALIVLWSLYYTVISATQCYSPEEQSVLLVLYVMTANRMRKSRNKQKALRASFARPAAAMTTTTTSAPSHKTNQPPPPNNQHHHVTNRGERRETNSSNSTASATTTAAAAAARVHRRLTQFLQLCVQRLPFLRSSGSSTTSTTTTSTNNSHSLRMAGNTNNVNSNNHGNDNDINACNNNNHNRENVEKEQKPFRNYLQPQHSLQAIHPAAATTSNTNTTTAVITTTGEDHHTLSENDHPENGIVTTNIKNIKNGIDKNDTHNDHEVFDTIHTTPSDEFIAHNPSFVHTKPPSRSFTLHNNNTTTTTNGTKNNSNNTNNTAFLSNNLYQYFTVTEESLPLWQRAPSSDDHNNNNNSNNNSISSHSMNTAHQNSSSSSSNNISSVVVSAKNKHKKMQNGKNEEDGEDENEEGVDWDMESVATRCQQISDRHNISTNNSDNYNHNVSSNVNNAISLLPMHSTTAANGATANATAPNSTTAGRRSETPRTVSITANIPAAAVPANHSTTNHAYSNNNNNNNNTNSTFTSI